MTGRDRTVAAVLVLVGLVAAYWFLLLAPKRDQAAKLQDQLGQQKSALSDAVTQAATALQSKQDYASNYATVARLGQAVPADDSVPSLVFQLDSAAKAAGVDFRGVKLEPSTSAAAALPTTPSSTSGSSSGDSSSGGSSSSSSDSSSSDSSSSGDTSSGDSSSSSSDSSSSGDSSSGGSSSSGDSSSSSDSSPSGSTSSTTAPTDASATAAAGLPPGASVGPAGFPTMPFTLSFRGSFFHMADFLRRIDRFVRTGGQTVRVGGRLLTVSGVALEPAKSGFPAMDATLAVNAYLIPPGQAATGGATPTAPAGGGPTTSTTSPTSPSTPATAAVTPTR